MNAGFWRRLVGLAGLTIALTTFAGAKTEHVALETNKGVIEIELYADKAPVSVANFLKYVDSGFYNGLIFHRVVAGFVIQAGGYDAKMVRREPAGAIVNESANRLHNTKGTVAMARVQEPNSATSQFFINIADNDNLDFHPGKPGYAVFGSVTAGMDVVEQIGDVETRDVDGMANVPTEPVVILSARRLP